MTNYDLCSGLGTPNGTNLINALVSGPVYAFKVSAPPAPYGATMSALSGGAPNGDWDLFVQDVNQYNSGMISNGWMITMTLGSPIGAEADLNILLAASTASVLPGSNFVYSLQVTNSGGLSTATNVIVQNLLPSGVTLLSSNITLGSIIRSGSQITWLLGNLITNAGGSLTLNVAAPTTSGSIVDSAIVQSDTPDPNPDDSGKSVTVVVGTPPLRRKFPLLILASMALLRSQSAVHLPRRLFRQSTNLTTWVSIYTTNSTAPFTFMDPNKTNYPYRFYRAVTGP